MSARRDRAKCCGPMREQAAPLKLANRISRLVLGDVGHVRDGRHQPPEPVPASLARSCPRSFDFVRIAHLAQDDGKR